MTATSAYGGSTLFTYSGTPALPFWQSKAGPDGYTKTTLDGMGRAIRVERGPDGSHIQSVTDSVYAPCACSPLGKLWKVSLPYQPGHSPAGWTVYIYDGLGRTVSVTQPDAASTTTYSYAGNQTTNTDPAGKWKKFTSDVEGNLTSVVEPDPANAPGGTLTTSYTYDWMRNLTGVSMPRGSVTQTRTFVYDGAGHLTSATNPENGTVGYTYNNDGSLWYKYDAKGADTVYTYDNVRRVTMVQYFPTGKANAENTCMRVSYTYGANPTGSTYSQNITGRLATAHYGACLSPGGQGVTEQYSYHAAGGVTGKRFQAIRCGTDMDGHYSCPTLTLDTSYTYDGNGKVYSVLYPGDSAPYIYGYDNMGRHNSLTRVIPAQPPTPGPTTETLVRNVQFDFAGRMTGMDFRYTQAYYLQYGYSNDYGVYGYWVYTDIFETESRAYDTMGRLSSIGWAAIPAYNVSARSLTYGFSATQDNGQITQMTDSASGETVSYQYDALKRLISACSSLNNCVTAPTTFQYDGFGNLTSKTLAGATTALPVNGTTNQLSNAIYDANGNMTSGLGLSMGYDEANRLGSVHPVSGGNEYYGYSPQGKRMWHMKADGTEEWTLYGAFGEKLGVYKPGPAVEHFDANGYAYDSMDFVAVSARTVWFDGREVGVSADRLGTNRSGGARYYPYGEEITSTANDRTKFGTYTRDGFTGLDYADQRFYESGYGRFNTADPYMATTRGTNDPTAPQSWNRYAYVTGDPVNLFDPGGTCGTPTQFSDGSNGTISISVSIPCGPVGGGAGSGYAAPLRPILEPPAGWDALSDTCKNALRTALWAHSDTLGIPAWLNAISRAEAASSTLQQAATNAGIDWRLLAAIGIRETGFLDIAQRSGFGRGIFQIDIGKNLGVSASQASDLNFAANWAANFLSSNMATIAQQHPNLDATHLLQATAASYNFGTGNISGNPNTIDKGSTHDNYGSNVLALIDCF